MKWIFFSILFLCCSRYLSAATLRIVAEENAERLVLQCWENGNPVEVRQWEHLVAGQRYEVLHLQEHKVYCFSGKSGYYVFYSNEPELNFIVGSTRISQEKPQGVNHFLGEWHRLSQAVRERSVEIHKGKPEQRDIAAFFSACDKLKGQANEALLLSARKGLGEKDYKLLRTVVASDLDWYQYTYAAITLPVVRLDETLRELLAEKIMHPGFVSEDALQFYPFFPMLIGLYDMIATRIRMPEEKIFECLCHDDIRAYYALEKLEGLNDYGKFADKAACWQPYFAKEPWKSRFEEVRHSLEKLQPGVPGYDFAFPDLSGEMVKLSDLSGKVVLVDVWATWCGPCKREIPALKKLKKEMEGTDVVVVGISVDDDEKAWKQMAGSIGGVQLLDAGNAMGKYYKFGSIPRFLVFDRNGCIVSMDAPRPSSPALKALLEKTLKENR